MARLKCYLCLCLALALMLGGCGNIAQQQSTPDNTTISVPEITEPEPTEPDPVITCQYLPQEVDNPENLPVLKWVCLTERPYGGGVRTWNETAAIELNQMLADKNMPFRVQFVLFAMDVWLTDSDWFSRPETQNALKNADLIYGMMTAEEMQNYLQPITEYVQADAASSLLQAVPHSLNWLSGTVEGEVYGIRTIPAQSWSNGWVIAPEVFDTYGLSADDFTGNFWEMDKVFQKIYAQNGNKPFLYNNNGKFLSTEAFDPKAIVDYFPSTIYDLINNIYFDAGAIFGIDYSGQTPKIVNRLDTETVRNIQNALTRYIEAGYITDQAAKAVVHYGSVAGAHTYTRGQGETVIPMTTPVFKATKANGYMSGISANTQNRECALTLLKLIVEDNEVAMQLFFGKEGRDYTIENGYYTLQTQEDSTSYSLDFISPLAYFCGMTSDKMTADMRSPGTENWNFAQYNGKTLLRSYQELLDESVLSYPVVFDYSGFEDELKAIETVCLEYFPKFTVLTETQYNQMLKELEDAGSQKIVEALQKQLDQWLSENPDWQ